MHPDVIIHFLNIELALPLVEQNTDPRLVLL